MTNSNRFLSHQAAAHSGCVVSIKHSPADVTLVCMRARGVYSIHRGGDILATHQGKGVYFINRRGDVILTTHLSKMILSGFGASQDSAPVGRRKQGPPSVVFQPYLASSSLSLLLCHHHHHHHYYLLIIIICTVRTCSLPANRSAPLAVPPCLPGLSSRCSNQRRN